MKKIDKLSESLTDIEKKVSEIESTIINEAWITVDMLGDSSLYGRLVELYETASSITEHLRVVVQEYKDIIVRS